MNNTSPPGFLEKVAAKAVAITAIFTLLYLLFPRLKPEAEASPGYVQSGLTASSDSTAPEPRSLTPAVETDARGVAAIRAVLTADAALARPTMQIEQSMPSSDGAPPSGGAIEYLKQQQEAQLRLAVAYQQQINGMRGLRLGETPAAFRDAYLAHTEAWQGKSSVVARIASLVGSAVLDLQAYGDQDQKSVLMPFYEQSKAVTASVGEADNAIMRTWDAVRRASLAVGVDPAEFEAQP